MTMMRVTLTLLLCVVPLAFGLFDRNPRSLPLLMNRQRKALQTSREKPQESQSKWQNPWKTSSATPSNEQAALTIPPLPPHRTYDTNTPESFQNQVERRRSVGSHTKRKQDAPGYHNIQDSTNSPRRTTSPSDTLRRRLHDSEHRNLQLDAPSTCEIASLYEEMEGALFGTACRCHVNDDDGSVTMKCADTACHYCNRDWSVCGAYTYGVVFDQGGDAIAFLEQDEYHLGRSDLVVFTDYNGETCEVSINDQECTSCSFNACANGGRGMTAVCSNLPG